MSVINDRVAYKPLGTAAKLDGEEENDLELGEDVFLRHPNCSKNYKTSPSLMGLRQFRILLYLVATLLLILFIAQLFSNKRVNSSHVSVDDITHDPTHSGQLRLTPTSTQATKQYQYVADINPQKSLAILEHSGPQPLHSDRPKYESYLTSVLQARNSNHEGLASDLFDDLHFPIDDQFSSASNKTGTWWVPGQRNSNKHITVTNYVRAMKSFNHLDSVTLSTQASIEFMYHTLELCKRWDGPISVSVFCPGVEMSVALTLIKYMRQCLPVPLSACIRDKVTWHIVYNRAHGPPVDLLGYPKTHLDSKNYPLFVNQGQCPKFAGPEPHDTIRQFQEALRGINGILTSNYRQQFNIQYPINVLRNVARQAAQTKHVLASDIELYPSINMVPMFIKYINEHDVKDEFKVNKFVFTLPLFEVKSNVTPPKTKRELIEMINQNDAIFFHKWVCDECQNFPNRLDWIQTDKFDVENYHAPDNELVIFEATQRDRSRRSWEPIFIGTNEDPPYDDRLSWDGRRDKMGQMYEMCLQDYRLLIAGNAFLVHAPGIKHIDQNDVKKRLSLIIENNGIYDSYMSKLKRQYSSAGTSHKC